MRIDWTPGAGRRGRPLRTVLGMGQRQGLILLSVVAGVSILLAGYTTLGGFDSGAPAGSATPIGADGLPITAVGDGPGAVPEATLTGAAQILHASTQHYTDLLEQGRAILGQTRYPDPAAYTNAFVDPKSPAALFTAYRTSPNPEADVSYGAAYDAARQTFGRHDPPAALIKWQTDMTRARADLGAWVAVAAQWQRSAADQGALDAAAAKITADLDAARADASAVGG